VQFHIGRLRARNRKVDTYHRHVSCACFFVYGNIFENVNSYAFIFGLGIFYESDGRTRTLRETSDRRKLKSLRQTPKRFGGNGTPLECTGGSYGKSRVPGVRKRERAKRKHVRFGARVNSVSGNGGDRISKRTGYRPSDGTRCDVKRRRAYNETTVYADRATETVDI